MAEAVFPKPDVAPVSNITLDSFTYLHFIIQIYENFALS